MKIGKWNLRWSTIPSIYQRRVKALWNPSLKYNPNWMKRWIINVTNDCSMKCYSCSALCDKPFQGVGFRDKFRITKLDHVEKFVTLLKDLRPHYWIRLTGGEPTIAGGKYLELLAEIVHIAGRNLSILTNGYRFLECDPFWFEQITFDNHVVNKPLIDECVDHCKQEGYTNYKIATNIVHRNLEAQRSDHITDGFNCADWLENLSLWREVVYPCCVVYYLDGWDKSDDVRDSLLEAGWHVDNPKLLDVIANWRNTIPAEVARSCLLSCWKKGKTEIFHPVYPKVAGFVKGQPSTLESEI